MVLCCVQLRFENSSPRRRIVGREYKILLAEFFNSSEKIAQSLVVKRCVQDLVEDQSMAENSDLVDRPCADVHKGRNEL